MTVRKEPTNLERGRIPRADRIQRLTIGGVLPRFLVFLRLVFFLT